MNVAIIGSGGREHAIAYKISESKSLERLFILPGNAGTASLGTNVNINIDNYEELLKFLTENEVTFVIIGPEKPLVDGMADFLRENEIVVFGPNTNAAKIEGNKSFSKKLMSKYGVPTAEYVEFRREEFDKAKEFVICSKYPLVIKADGLAAGKGVLICENIEQALTGLNEIFSENVFGRAGDRIIIEEFMVGEEASIFAITDGIDYICLPAAQDHKRIGDGDTGKNTGGMGAYAPAPIINDELLEEVKKRIIEPVIAGMNQENRKFNGCLYCGLMITAEGPKVVEFNCRFGDPETQAVLPLIEGDFLELLYSAGQGRLNPNSITFKQGCSICVITASAGYPDSYESGYEVNIPNNLGKDIIVFHSGTRKEKNKIYTSGGRVLGVTTVLQENDLQTAQSNVYDALKNISYRNIYYRTDIADKGFKKN